MGFRSAALLDEDSRGAAGDDEPPSLHSGAPNCGVRRIAQLGVQSEARVGTHSGAPWVHNLPRSGVESDDEAPEDGVQLRQVTLCFVPVH